MKEKIRSLTTFSILFFCVINSAHALPPAPDDCNISISPTQLDYGEITSNRMYNEGTRNNDGTIDLEYKYFTLMVICQNPRFITIELSAAKPVDENSFDAKHESKVTLFVDKITTNKKLDHGIKFWPRGSSDFVKTNSHAWGAGHILANTKLKVTRMVINMKVKPTLPESIRKTRTPLDIGTDLTFTLGGNVGSIIHNYEQDEADENEFFFDPYEQDEADENEFFFDPYEQDEADENEFFFDP